MMDLLQHLWPDFSALSAGTTNGLSAVFWLGMMTIFLVAIGFLARHFLRFNARMKALHSLLEGETKETLALNRRETLHKALALKDAGIGQLWREFDESLVSSADQKQLFNTLDAEHFFNARTLALGLTASRLLAATPSFLLAIGVLGTFVGLTVGLEQLVVKSSDVELLKTGIDHLIGGAAVAFMTSVWGVGLSLLLNVIEKLLERRALGRIHVLQHKIDFLYTRIPAEQSLVHIADYSKESSQALQELHERIGDRLQETLNGMNEAMQTALTDALNNIMGPAIQTLVSSASQQSSQVMEHLVGSFMEGMTSVGREQGSQMQQAAAEVNAAVSGMSERLNQLFSSLSEQQNRQQEVAQQQSSRFESQLERISSSAEERQQQLEQRFNALMSGLTGQLDSQLGAAQKREEERQALFERAQAEAGARQQELLEQLASSTREQMQSMAEAGNERHSNLEKVFSRLMMNLNSQLEAQMSAAEQREQARAERHEQQQAAASAQQQQLVGSLSQTTQQQLDALVEAASSQQRNLQAAFAEQLERLNAQMAAAEQREQARAERYEQQQAAATAQQQQLVGSLGETTQQQLNAMVEAATRQQQDLQATFGAMLGGLNEQMSAHNGNAEQREQARQQNFEDQLARMASQQQELLESIAQAVQTTQQQSLLMATQHQQLMERLQQATEAAATSSKHMDSSANQLGLLSANVRQAAQVLGERLEAVTQRIESAGSQNAQLAEHLQGQSASLSQLQAALLEGAQRFEQAASEARSGFGDMKSHQQEFLSSVRSEFTALGEALRKEVEGVEKQAEEWLRSFSGETGRQVDERMNQWNKQTLSFADQMYAAVQAISNVVDELGAR